MKPAILSLSSAFVISAGCGLCGAGSAAAGDRALTLAHENKWLLIRGAHLPGGVVRVHYLEVYRRAGSTTADAAHSAISHTNELISLSDDHRVLRLRDTLADGLIVEHRITAGNDEVDFHVTARNPTDRRSEAHWAAPCVRVGIFTGFNPDSSKRVAGDYDGPVDYLPKCFVFLDGSLARMPTRDWAIEARYSPGQVWRPAGVPKTDLSPRPLNPHVPSNGLIGCFSGDERLIFATAWEPYQCLFQGVARCLHSQFRLGGLQAGETKQIRGKIYLVPNDVTALVRRYEKDFPEHVAKK